MSWAIDRVRKDQMPIVARMLPAARRKSEARSPIVSAAPRLVAF